MCMETKQTFHVYAQVGQGTHRFTVYAIDHAAAKAYAESEGHTVAKVRKAPTPPIDNLARHHHSRKAPARAPETEQQRLAALNAKQMARSFAGPSQS